MIRNQIDRGVRFLHFHIRLSRMPSKRALAAERKASLCCNFRLMHDMVSCSELFHMMFCKFDKIMSIVRLVVKCFPLTKHSNVSVWPWTGRNCPWPGKTRRFLVSSIHCQILPPPSAFRDKRWNAVRFKYHTAASLPWSRPDHTVLAHILLTLEPREHITFCRFEV